MDKKSQNLTRLLTKMVKHGAAQVDIEYLFKQSQLIWNIGSHQEISDTCIHLEEFMSSAARNCRNALQVIDRMDGSSLKDPDLLTALKKYVEDTSEAIKEVDSTLDRSKSSLTSLIFEIPNETSEHELSWRNLIARRIIIAHKLLTIDDEKVYCEAKRDFGSLNQLLSKIYFVPVKTNFDAGEGFHPLLRADALKNLAPSTHGKTPKIGEALIFICEDKTNGFLTFRLGRTEDNKVLMSASAPCSIPFSLHSVKVES